jgi:hypothetical protein
MTTSISSSPLDIYRKFLEEICPNFALDILSKLLVDQKSDAWDNPESAIELNNFAVLALIEAEQCEDFTLRSMNLDMALQALENGITLQPSHPLCVAHLALVRSMIGELHSASEIAFVSLLQILQPAYNAAKSAPVGLVYLPPDHGAEQINRAERLSKLLHIDNGYLQALSLLTDILYRSQLVFYNSNGMRFLQLALQIAPDSAELNLKLGLASLKARQWEGLLYLHRAHQLAPHSAPVMQALHLAYRELQQPDLAEV